LSCHLVGNTKGPLREAASPGVLVTLVDFCLRWSGPVRTGALSAPTSAAPAGREATGPWSQRTRSLRPSTASGQHPARKPHCGSRLRGFVACPLPLVLPIRASVANPSGPAINKGRGDPPAWPNEFFASRLSRSGHTRGRHTDGATACSARMTSCDGCRPASSRLHVGPPRFPG